MKKLALAVFLSVLFAGAPKAQEGVPVARFIDGNELFELCRRAPVTAEFYIVGALDMLEIMAAAGYVEKSICIPDGVIGQQLGGLVCQLLETNPTERHQHASTLVLAAVGAGFPCDQ